MRLRKQVMVTLGVVLMGCGAVPPLEAGRLGPDPATFFITQYVNPRYHPDPAPADNANCGPTSLAMALRAFGKAPPEPADHPEALIEAVREAMTGKRDNGAWTYPYQFPAAASQFGLAAAVVRGGSSAVLAQLALPGRMVVVNVNPTPAYASKLAIPFDGGHFALVTGCDGDRVFLNDPLAAGPLTITRRQLETALSTPLGPDISPFGGGVVLWAR